MFLPTTYLLIAVLSSAHTHRHTLVLGYRDTNLRQSGEKRGPFFFNVLFPLRHLRSSRCRFRERHRSGPPSFTSLLSTIFFFFFSLSNWIFCVVVCSATVYQTIAHFSRVMCGPFQTIEHLSVLPATRNKRSTNDRNDVSWPFFPLTNNRSKCERKKKL